MAAGVISYQTRIVNGEVQHLEIQDLTYQDGTTKRIVVDRLPEIREKCKQNGLDDFCFAPQNSRGFGGNWRANGLGGVRYEDCDNAEALAMEYSNGLYRSLEAKQLLHDLLVNKFHYHEQTYVFPDGKVEKYLIADNTYKSHMKSSKIRQSLIDKISSEGVIRVRFNEEISRYRSDGIYKSICATCKDARGIRITIMFPDDYPMKHYKNDMTYFHALDYNGDVIKTRGHYCTIKCHVAEESINDPNEYDSLSIMCTDILKVE